MQAKATAYCGGYQQEQAEKTKAPKEGTMHGLSSVCAPELFFTIVRIVINTTTPPLSLLYREREGRAYSA
jgi:hypothetical protein